MTGFGALQQDHVARVTFEFGCPELVRRPGDLADTVLGRPLDAASRGRAPRLRGELLRLGPAPYLRDDEIVIRMTGCPNGCARPYTADLAFVGRSLNKYVVYVGGNLEGTRLGTEYATLVPLDQLVSTVRPLFERFRDERVPGERFGDFWHRVGVQPVQAVGASR